MLSKINVKYVYMYAKNDKTCHMFADFAVGAYVSDQVMVFRTRPIVSFNITIAINPTPIPLNSSTLKCHVDDRLCFVIDVRFAFTSISQRVGLIDNLSKFRILGSWYSSDIRKWFN